MGSGEISIIFDETTHPLYSGKTISGKVVIKCVGEKNAESIFICFIGKAKVVFYLGYGQQRYRNSSREHLLNHQIALAGNESKPLDLPTGYIGEYPFSFVLPPDLPSSLAAEYGHVQYYAVAGIQSVDNSVLVLSRRSPFTVNSVVDLNLITEAGIPVDLKCEKEVVGIFRSKGMVTFTIKMPKSGFVPGEKIRLTIDIDNQSKECVCCTVTLQQQICFQAKRTFQLLDHCTHSKLSSAVVATSVSPKVERGAKYSWKVDDLVVNSLPSSGLGECQIISVGYELKVKLKPKGSDDWKYKFPIVIGSIPLSNAHSYETGRPINQRRNARNKESPPAYQDYSLVPPPSYEEAILQEDLQIAKLL